MTVARLSEESKASAEKLAITGLFPEADDGGRTRDLRLGKPTLYQLSYVRAKRDSRGPTEPTYYSWARCADS
jgi:hypothetical protein